MSLRLPPKSSFTSSTLRFWSLRKPQHSSFYSNLNRRGWPILGQPHAGVFGLLRPAATSSMNRGGLKSFDSTILVLLYSLNLSYRPYGRYLFIESTRDSSSLCSVGMTAVWASLSFGDYFTKTLTALAFRNPHGMSFTHATCDLLLLGCRASRFT